MENKSREKLEKKLYRDVNELVREGDDGAEGFLKSLTDLVESEKYRKITSELEEGEEGYAPAEEGSAAGKRDEAVSDESEPEDLEEIMALISGDSLIKASETETFEEGIERNLHEQMDVSDKEEKEVAKPEVPSDGSDPVPPKKKKKKKWVYDLIMVACIGVFVYCVGRIGYYYYMGYKYNKSNKGIQDMVGDISQKIITKAPEVITDVDIYFPDELVYASVSTDKPEFVDDVTDDWKKKYASLVEHNPDCVGYIQIPDTKINYPVMYTPGDYEKYLYKDFEGNYQFRGLPFMAEYTLLNRSQNYIIYGHNMNDGSAFGNLKKYLYKKWADEHPYCYFNTAYSEGVYQVMAVVLTKIYNVEDECFKYYKYVGELSEEDFNTYVYYMKKMSQYNTGVDAVWGDQLLTLSTCHRVHDPEGRLVVVFKRIQ